MKMTFFLIAFCLVFIRLYLGWTGQWGYNGDDGTITSDNGDDYTQLKWSGKAKLNENETSIESITPGGYLKFTHNDERMVAESNLQGDITYDLHDGRRTLTMDADGKKFLARIIQEMIGFGFDARGRMERIYKKGGKKALFDEEANLKSDQVRDMYIDRLLQTDSLTREDMIILTRQIGELGPDFEKSQRLRRINPEQLKDTGVMRVWLAAVEHIGNDHDKNEVLGHLVDKGSISEEVEGRVLDITASFGNDWEKQNLIAHLLRKDTIYAGAVDKLLAAIGRIGDDNAKKDLLSTLIDRDTLSSTHFDETLQLIGRFNADYEKEALYKKMIEKRSLTEEEWISLIRATGEIRQDMEKADLLVKIARKMPAGEALNLAYRDAARTINTDQEYGKAIRAVE